MMKNLVVIVSLLLLNSCSTGKYAATNKVYKKQVQSFSRLLKEYPIQDSAGLAYASDWVGTTNMSLRKPNFVILHHTAQNSCEQTLKTFTQPGTAVSSHYVVCREGKVYHLLNDLLRGHHAGVSKWGNSTDLNSCSIGIEIDNNGSEPFTSEQINSLLILLDRLKKAYNIPAANFIGHADVAPGRKVDPSRFFPWQKLAEKGFGYWYDTVGLQLSANFDPLQALRIIGYNISKPDAAIASFKLHFVPADTLRQLTAADKKIISALELKYK